jgi:hypothetical protein
MMNLYEFLKPKYSKNLQASIAEIKTMVYLCTAFGNNAQTLWCGSSAG